MNMLKKHFPKRYLCVTRYLLKHIHSIGQVHVFMCTQLYMSKPFAMISSNQAQYLWYLQCGITHTVVASIPFPCRQDIWYFVATNMWLCLPAHSYLTCSWAFAICPNMCAKELGIIPRVSGFDLRPSIV